MQRKSAFLIAAFLLPAAAAPLPASAADASAPIEAVAIARRSECAQKGAVGATGVYNENSRTWWIDFAPHARHARPGCNPACVVSVDAGSAEINWRCTGAVAPTASTRLIQAVSYRCDGGKQIDARYYDGAAAPARAPGQPPTPGGSVSLALSDGRRMTLPQTVAASGIRYASPDDAVVFWSKGDDAFLTEQGSATYADCRER